MTNPWIALALVGFAGLFIVGLRLRRCRRELAERTKREEALLIEVYSLRPELHMPIYTEKEREERKVVL